MENSKKIGVAVIGCGGRARYVVKNLFRDSNRQIEVLSVYDPIDSIIDKAFEEWAIDGKNTKRCASADEAINTNGVEWVMVFSPNAFHKEHILSAFAAKKHVFSEKPLATAISDCQAIFDAHKKTDLLFATGFVLRYAPIYKKIKNLLDSGEFGKLLSIEANENIPPYHGGYIMANWRRKKSISGPHILEKCCHDLDLINWFCQSLPSKIAAFGSKKVFMSSNKFMEEKYGKETFAVWGGHNQIDSSFNDDNDMLDTQMGIALYRNGIQVSFCATMCNAIPERRMRFNCMEGTIVADLYTRKLVCKKIGDEAAAVYNFNGDGHGGGDDFIMKELFASMSQGVPPKCSGQEGLESAVYALALDEAMVDMKIVDLEPIWESLNR